MNIRKLGIEMGYQAKNSRHQKNQIARDMKTGRLKKVKGEMETILRVCTAVKSSTHR